MSDGRIVVLVTVDAWRADFVDEHAGVALTPNLAAAAARTVRFDRVWANGPWTTPALVSLFTGESPARHDVHYEWSAPRPGGPAVARILAEHGFDVPNLCYLNRVRNYANLGYEAAGAPDYPHSPEDDLLLPALRACRDRRGAAFLWFHYKFVHLPYWAGEPYRRALGIDDAAIHPRLRESVCTGFVVPRQQFHLEPEDRAMAARLYAAGVLEMDAWLGRLLEELDRGSGELGARTTVVVTSDHGEELLEHGHVGHASTAHHAQLHEEVLRIPLLIVDRRAGAGSERGASGGDGGARRIGLRVQGLDLHKTLLGLAGVTVPGHGPGIDLSPLILDPRAAPPSGAGERPFYFRSARMGYLTPRTHDGHEIEALSDGKQKIVMERYDAPRALLYDLEADAAERSPRTTGPEVEAACAELAAARAALAADGEP